MYSTPPSLVLKMQSKTVNEESRIKNLLEIPKSRTAYGSRAFSSAGPMLWNNLPNNLRTLDSLESFKSKLKTFPFKCTYLSST